MKYSRVGNSGLEVSKLGLGTNNFGTQLDEAATNRVIQRSIDLGVNLLDTANIYAKQRSEELIGRAIKGRRDDVVVATKVASKMGEGPNMSGLSRRHIMWQIRESLRRLQTDYIDLYYIHHFDPDTPLEETLGTFDQLVKSGLVRYAGVSNLSLAQLKEVVRVCDERDLERPVALQPPYSLLDRKIEVDIMPYCEEKGLGILSYSPLAGGFLTGKYKKDQPPPEGSRAAVNSSYGERVRNRDFAALDRIALIAKDSGLSMRQLALAWLVSHPAITSPMVGASNPEQVEENCQAIEIRLPDETLHRLNTL